ncbi:MAG: hypothetical protein J6V36_04125, partial [Clostridia bacterium]|nr:hypothetical protein [Clostridia bacterium]
MSTGELISQDTNDRLSDDVIKNIQNYVKNAPSISNMSLSSDISSLSLDAELEKRKNNFVVSNENENVLATDTVNVTFIEVTLSSGDATYELNVGYDFNLNEEYDASFKNGIIGHKIGEKFIIENCKMPDGTTAKVKVKINYVIRKVDSLEALEEKLPVEFDSYSSFLSKALEDSAKANDIWEQLIKTVTVETNSEEYKAYYSKKYNNAYEYFKNYNSSVDEDVLKTSIEKQCKKEFIAYYYGKEFGIDYGEYREEELEKIALFYGYTLESFKAKYSEDVIKNTVYM